MEFKVLEGSVKFIEESLNRLKEEFDINILGVSSSPQDLQLGTGGICIIFTIGEFKKIDIAKIPIKEIAKEPKEPKKPLKRNTASKKKEK